MLARQRCCHGWEAATEQLHARKQGAAGRGHQMSRESSAVCDWRSSFSARFGRKAVLEGRMRHREWWKERIRQPHWYCEQYCVLGAEQRPPGSLACLNQARVGGMIGCWLVYQDSGRGVGVRNRLSQQVLASWLGSTSSHTYATCSETLLTQGQLCEGANPGSPQRLPHHCRPFSRIA